MSNISEDYILDYIRGILPERDSYLKEMEKYAIENHVPIIESEVAQLLRVLLKMKRPKDILEVGTAIGYSALVMCDAQLGDCRITTIERRDDMIELAEEFILKSPYRSNINIIKGEAEDILSEIEGMYDLIFIDAAKGQYLEFFNRCMDLLRPGGFIVSDNVLFKGMVATDELVIRRKKTIVKRLRQFLKYINELDGYTSSVIPIGDGVALTYKEV
ncbi:O-methyltransferase [Tissierellaceae bacterium HCP3S3_D8]